MTGESLSIIQDHLEKLKQLFPETVTEGKIDWEKLQATLGKENIEFLNERYVLNWAGKSEAFKVLQQSTTATLKPSPEESINFETTENVFIEGENLEVLKVLQKAYYGKIKCIIIDPPYNTGNDSFIYPDSFKESKEDYQKRIGEKDEEGYLLKEGLFRKNSKESGHYHSNWLSMMYPRLFLSKNLLSDEGLIFIHIDDNEVHNLRLLMNEIFGEENFISQFIWKSRQNKDNRNITGASIDHEYVICYGKRIKGSERKTEQYKNPDNDRRGPWVSGNMVGLLPQEQRPNCHYDLVDPESGINYGKPKLGWRYDQNTMSRLIEEKRILWPAESSGRPRRKVFLNELSDRYTGFSSIIGEKLFTRNGTAEIDELFGFKAFEFPKPSDLIKELISQSVEDGDIVLDFFCGSGTTAHAVLKWNVEHPEEQVKYLLVQLPEKINENSESFKKGFKTIADLCKERIVLVIESIKTKSKSTPKFFENTHIDLGFKVFKLSPSNFKIWRGSEVTDENLELNLESFTDPVKPESLTENMLYELILKSGYSLTDKIERNDSFYSVNDGELIVALNEMSQAVLSKIISSRPKKVITLDKLFAGNDQLKTNTVLQMLDAEIDFKTI